jgi:hypothetical protein
MIAKVKLRMDAIEMVMTNSQKQKPKRGFTLADNRRR